jgi:hypothetical protein
MSRAFVKDAEDKPDDLPDRPISPHHNFVTEAGLAAIDAALARFEAAHAAAMAKGKMEAGQRRTERSALLEGAARDRGGRQAAG